MITEEELALTIAKTINRLNDIMRLDDDVSRDELLSAYEALNISRPVVRLDWFNKEFMNIEEATRLANLKFEFSECRSCGIEYFEVNNDGTGCDGMCNECWLNDEVDMNEFIEKAYSWNNDFPNGLDGVFVDVDNRKLTFNLGNNAKSRYVVAGLLEASPELKYIKANNFAEYVFEWVGG